MFSFYLGSREQRWVIFFFKFRIIYRPVDDIFFLVCVWGGGKVILNFSQRKTIIETVNCARSWLKSSQGGMKDQQLPMLQGFLFPV